MILFAFILFAFFIGLGSFLLLYGENKPIVKIVGRLFIVIGLVTFIAILIYFYQNFK